MKLRFGLFAMLITTQAITSLATIYSKPSKLVTVSETNAEGILFFEGTWEEAKLKARAEKKLIFLDAYASWCGPCKIMSRTTFTDKHVGLFFNEHFINFKMDMEKSPEGPRLSKQFKLIAYPTLYFLDATEKIIKQEIGLVKAKPFLKIGQEIIASK